MADINKPVADELIPCEVCLKEIPPSAASSEEVEEYFYYFCGLDCYKQWQEQGKKDEG